MIFLNEHRFCKSHIPFFSLDVSRRKHFYGGAAKYYIENEGGVTTYTFSAEQVARQSGLAIAACDRQSVHQSVRNRVLGRKKMANVFPDIENVTIDAEGVVETVRTLDVNVIGVQPSKSNAKRIGNNGRKRKEDGELPSNKLKKKSHGAESFIEYQEACKEEATATSLLIRDQHISYRGAAKSMQAALMAKCVSVHVITCRD
jgi:hypothetical protein